MDMNRTTGIMVVVAALSAVGALSMRPKTMAPPTFEDTGEQLFPEFEDPTAAAFLEVKEYDEKEARLTSFSVKLDEGVWVIPSHNNYPADGTERMGKAAASFLGAKKDQVRSDDAKEHAEFGVVDPEGDADVDAEGARGQRVTIRDAAGTTLVDLIIGKDVPDKQGYKYVRYPGKDRVYAVELKPEISTSFTDWIEDDLLKIEQDNIVALLSNSYTVDEESGVVEGDNPLYFELKAPTAFGPEGEPMPAGAPEWTLSEPAIVDAEGKPIDRATYTGEVPLPPPPSAPAGKELNPSKVKQIVGSADRLKIVGVRPQPERLSALDLLGKGFFVGGEPPNQRLFGNEGEVRLFANDGVVYTLYFGEITYATGETLTAGGEGEEQAEVAEGENARANRYMFVAVGYDPTRDPGAADAPDPLAPPRGKARAEMLAKRFNQWYYVIADASFTQLHKAADDFWRDAPDAPAGAGAPEGMPAMPEGMALPEGMPMP